MSDCPNKKYLSRTSSLGEESEHDHYGSTTAWRDKHKTNLQATKDTDATTTLSTPLFTFGVIADIQFAPIPDGHSYSGQPRYYRHSLEVARHAATHFEKEDVSLVVNLGDIIDGKCQDVETHGGDKLPPDVDPGVESIQNAIDSLSPYTKSQIIHTYGNHELYNLDRTVLGELLNIPFVKEPCGDLVGYRSVVHGSTRFVVLDTYDVALLNRCPNTSRKHQSASTILAKYNPNFPTLPNSPEGMEELNKRYVGFNGAVDQPQLEWLQQTLQQAREQEEKVIVLSHQPILPGSSNPVCLVWNYEEVLDVLRDYSDVVVASLSGHAHKGGYQRDEHSGIHFRVIEAALESPSPIKTYGIVDMYDDRLVVRGFGHCQSAEYDFDHMLSARLANATL